MPRTPKRFLIDGMTSIHPIEAARVAGIYTLEFSNGDVYVGQSVDVADRFTQHVHGGSHHAPWSDAIAITIDPCSRADLNRREWDTIRQQQRLGAHLRNRTFNFGFEGRSPLDDYIEPEDQKHWACSDASFDVASFRAAASDPRGALRLDSSAVGRLPWPWAKTDEDVTLAGAAIWDLATVIERIPDAVRQERRYWTVSDSPRTAGGRLLTLSVGALEMLYVPTNPAFVERTLEGRTCTLSVINLPAGSITDESGRVGTGIAPFLQELDATVVRHHGYKLVDVDALEIPTGHLHELFERPEIGDAFSAMCLNLMRKNQSGLFRRWHAHDLALAAYEEIAENPQRDRAAAVRSRRDAADGR